MKLSTLAQTFAVCRLDANNAIPSWVLQSPFFSIGKTNDELSIVCEQKLVPDGIKCERDWRAFKVEGPLDFGLTGILTSIANPLAEAKISIFVISTFDTDYVMIRANDFERARLALVNAGFDFT